MYKLEIIFLILTYTATYNNGSNNSYKLRFDLLRVIILSLDTADDFLFLSLLKQML